jgi:hypothetical protein
VSQLSQRCHPDKSQFWMLQFYIQKKYTTVISTKDSRSSKGNRTLQFTKNLDMPKVEDKKHLRRSTLTASTITSNQN